MGTPVALQIFVAAAKAVVRVFIIAALGCYARHKNLLDADTARTMSRLNGAVFLPCLLFTVLGKAVKAEQLQNVWLLPIAAAVHIGLGWTLGKSVCAVFNVPREFRGPAVAAASFGNTFALPVVLLDAIIGSGNKVGHVQFTEDDNAAMVLYLSAYMTVLTTLMWTLGPVWMKAEELEADDDDDEEALGDGGSTSPRNPMATARSESRVDLLELELAEGSSVAKVSERGTTGTTRRVKARGGGAESQNQNRGGAGAPSRWLPRRTSTSSRR
jgi:predicted permease